MQKILCSVGILTFNSGTTLRRALESVKEIDDIIICDGGSTDDTLAIANEYGAHIISQDATFKREDGSLKDYAGVRNQCLAAARHNWFLYLDSDEAATKELVDEIRHIVDAPNPTKLVYNLSPRIVLEDRVILHSSNYPGWQKRFFNRSTGAYFRKAVHERIEYDRSLYQEGFLKGHWHYFISREVPREKLKKYAAMDATRNRKDKLLPLLKMSGIKVGGILKTFLKVSFIYLRYGLRDSMPPHLEFSRVYYQFRCLVSLWGLYFGITKPYVS